MRPAFHLLHNQEHSRSVSNFEILYDVPNQDLSAEEIGGQRGPNQANGHVWNLETPRFHSTCPPQIEALCLAILALHALLISPRRWNSVLESVRTVIMGLIGTICVGFLF
jgi:hypothetical protein